MAKRNTRALRQEIKRIETAKAEAMKIETTKEEPKRLATTKAEPVVKMIETMKNSGNAKVYLQYDGKEVDISAVIKKLEASVDPQEELRIYIKPEDDKIYYVCADKTGDISM